MVSTFYEQELAQLGRSFAAGLEANIDQLKLVIAGASESSLIGVGSGGSYTVASLLCNLHEAFTGRVSRPATPLELICNPTLASASPVFLISAEGKNPDIVEALDRAREHSSRTVHVLTNRGASPLMERVRELHGATPHVFELAEKDGYLAINSLLLDSVLVARAYSELDRNGVQLPNSIEDLRIGNQTVTEWTHDANDFVTGAVTRKGLIVVFSPLLRPVAADLESKLAESALMHCQLADLRSFAHGRHLWLAERAEDCAILALTEPGLDRLVARVREFVSYVSSHTHRLPPVVGSKESIKLLPFVLEMIQPAFAPCDVHILVQALDQVTMVREAVDRFPYSVWGTSPFDPEKFGRTEYRRYKGAGCWRDQSGDLLAVADDDARLHRGVVEQIRAQTDDTRPSARPLRKWNVSFG